MKHNKTATTGIKELDVILRSLWIGDNVVWEVEAGTYVELFAYHFVRATLEEGHQLVYVSFNRSPATMVKRFGRCAEDSNFTLIDCFTAGKGRNDPTFMKFHKSGKKTGAAVLIENPGDSGAFLKTLNRIEESKGPRTRYVFDSLTGMQDLWGDENIANKLFTRSCPRLYDMDTVAYWLLEKDAHSPAFRANIKHITQVALELISADSRLYLKANKVEGRYARNLYKPRRYEVINEEIHFTEAEQPRRLDIGTKIKSLRSQRGMTQRDLADKVGVTASFISQVERNQISPSIASLSDIADELRADLSSFFQNTRSDVSANTVVRREERRGSISPATRRSGATLFAITSEVSGRRMEAFHVELNPGAENAFPLFIHKGDEFCLVLRGKIEITLSSGGALQLSEGDSAYFDVTSPTGWKNPGKKPAVVIWVLSPSRL